MVIDDDHIEFEIGALGEGALYGVENRPLAISNRYDDAGFYRKCFRSRLEPFRSAAATRRRFVLDAPSRCAPFRFGSRDCADPHNRTAFDPSAAHQASTRCTTVPESARWRVFPRSLSAGRKVLPISSRCRFLPGAQPEPTPLLTGRSRNRHGCCRFDSRYADGLRRRHRPSRNRFHARPASFDRTCRVRVRCSPADRRERGYRSPRRRRVPVYSRRNSLSDRRYSHLTLPFRAITPLR